MRQNNGAEAMPAQLTNKGRLIFDRGSGETRVRWLARQMSAQCRPAPGLGEAADMACFTLRLPDAFPLPLTGGICPVALPPAHWTDQQVLEGLNGLGAGVCLVIGATPAQRATLSRCCRSPETWWVGPDDAEISALLLATEPLDALSRLIARYVRVARVSPYQTSNAVRRERGFFGRAQILSHIQHSPPANYLLVGGRQLGKTSLLLELERRYAKDPAVECCYCSIGFRPIAALLARVLGLPPETDLQSALRILAEPIPGQRRLILIDEADNFVEQDAGGAHGAPYACLNAFRSLSDEGHCDFILAGFWGLYRRTILEYHSPISNFSEVLTLGALEPEACRAMICEPLGALDLRLVPESLVDRIIEATGQRANLIAILCNEMLKDLTLASRELTEVHLARAMDSQSLRSALDGWSELTTDRVGARLDRILCYALVEQDRFGFADALDRLAGLGVAADAGQVMASLTRLELAFIIAREAGRYRWQVPLWREHLLAEEPASLLEREISN